MLLPTRIGSGVGTNFASTASIAQSVTVTNAGDTLILTVINRGVTSGYAATAVSGAGATWYRLATGVNATSAGAIDIWAGVTASSGAQTVTVTINGTQISGCWVEEWQYVNNSALIQSAAASATGSTTTPTLAITPVNVGDVAFVASSSANTETASPGAPYTTITGPTSSGAQVAGLAFWVVDRGTAQTASWTQTTGQWTVVGLILTAEQPRGAAVWNDPTASSSSYPAVLTASARRDFLDDVSETLASTGTGVISGCAVLPHSGSDFNYAVAAGTIAFNWGQVTLTTVASQAVTANSSGDSRRDLVYADGAGVTHYLVGTAAAIPAIPAPPIYPYIALAVIDVPNGAGTLDNGTSTSNAHIIDKRSPISGFGFGGTQTLFPSGVITESIPRLICQSNLTASGSGALKLTAIWVPGGVAIGHLIFASATTAASTPTHWWFGLYDNNLNQLALTADQSTTAWAASTWKSLAIASTIESSSATTFTTRYTGLHYVGFMMAASTVVTLVGVNNGAIVSATGQAPIPCGTSDSSQTTLPAFPHAATSLTSAGNAPYCAVAA